MALHSFACSYGNHSECIRAKACECECHKGDLAPVLALTPIINRMVDARERAHEAVKLFDHRPDLPNTTAAIEALANYEQILKEQQ